MVLVPRNLTKAAGFYNTMLQSDDPAVIVECLNGYRLKEKQPDNLGEFTVPVGKIEVTKEGKRYYFGDLRFDLENCHGSSRRTRKIRNFCGSHRCSVINFLSI